MIEVLREVDIRFRHKWYHINNYDSETELTAELIIGLDEEVRNVIIDEISRQERSEQSIHNSSMQHIAILAAISTLFFVQLLAVTETMFDMGGIAVYMQYAALIIMASCTLVGLTLLDKYNSIPEVGSNLYIINEIINSDLDLECGLLNNRLDALKKLQDANTMIYKGANTCTRLLTYGSILALSILIAAAI